MLYKWGPLFFPTPFLLSQAWDPLGLPMSLSYIPTPTPGPGPPEHQLPCQPEPSLSSLPLRVTLEPTSYKRMVQLVVVGTCRNPRLRSKNTHGGCSLAGVSQPLLLNISSCSAALCRLGLVVASGPWKSLGRAACSGGGVKSQPGAPGKEGPLYPPSPPLWEARLWTGAQWYPK